MLGLGLSLNRLSGTLKGIVRRGLQLWLKFTKSEVIGIEKVVNGDFATDSDWEEGVGWDINTVENRVDCDGTQTSTSTLTTSNGLDIQGLYVLFSFEISNYSSGTLSATIQGTGGVEFSSISGDEVYSINVISNDSNPTLIFTASSDFIGSISNVTIKEVTQFVIDKSPNTNNAKLFTGKALSFDGNDSVDIRSALGLSGAFSIAFWVKLTNYTTSVVVGDAANEDWFRINSAINYTLKLNNESSTNIATGANIPLDTWKRVVLIRDSDDLVTLAVDGTIYTNNAPRRAGDFDFNRLGEKAGTFIRGLLSDVQVYNKAWTTEDVAFDYNNPNLLAIDNPATSLVVTDLKAYWAMSEGDGLVAYDSGSTLEEEEVQNGDFSEVGSEEVEYGSNENAGSGWNANSNWDKSVAGLFSCDGTTNNDINQGTTIAVQGKSYLLSYEILSVSVGGSFVANFGGGTSGTKSELGVHSEVITAINDNRISIRPNATGTIGSVTNISVKQVDPNDDWTLGTGWSYGDDKAIFDGVSTGAVANWLRYYNITEVGSKYKVEFDIETEDSGIVGKFTDGSATYIDMGNGSGHYEGIYTTLSTQIGFTVVTNKSYSISNISVKEITQSDHGGLVSGATYVDKQPTIPQLGMMDWAKGSNLIPYSEDFTEWIETDVTLTVNATTSPIGSLDATLVDLSSTTDSRLVNNVGVVASTEYTLSFYLKKHESDSDGTFPLAYYNGSNYIKTYVNLTNVWQRFDLTFTNPSNSPFGYGLSRKGTTSDETLTRCYAWGAQVEESSSAGNYILTDGEAAIDVTTIENPTNKGYDILGNPLRLRQNAFNLDGKGYAEIVDDTTLDFSTGDFSIECWAKFDFKNKDSTWNSIVSLGDSIISTTSAGLATRVGKFYFNIGGTTTVSSTPVLVVGDWYHVVGVRRGTTMSLYINSLAESITATSAQTVKNTSSNIIGDDEDSTYDRSYENLIDDVRLYNRALSQKEITNNYNIGLESHRNQLVFLSQQFISAPSGVATYPANVTSNNSITFDDTVLEEFIYEQDTQVRFYEQPITAKNVVAGVEVLISGRVTKEGSTHLEDNNSDGYILIAMTTGSPNGNALKVHVDNDFNGALVNDHNSNNDKVVKVDEDGYFSKTIRLERDFDGIILSAADIMHDPYDNNDTNRVLISGFSALVQ